MAAEHGRAEGESMAAAARSCRSRGGGGGRLHRRMDGLDDWRRKEEEDGAGVFLSIRKY